MVFKALGEPTRLRIIKLLAEHEMCVCDLEKIMDISQPRISQHLKILKQAELIRERRVAQRRVCSFNWQQYEKVIGEFEKYLRTPLSEAAGFEKESRRLATMELGTCCIETGSH